MGNGKKVGKYLLIVLGVIALLWLVTLTPVFRKTFDNGLTLYGNVDVRQVDIGFRVPGLVHNIEFEEGDFVRAGVKMATLEKSPYDAQLERAKANVAAVATDLANTEILLNRRRGLIGVGGVSQEDLDDVTAQFTRLAANLEAAKADLKIAEDNLSFTEAYAPNDGIVLTRIKEPGSVVVASDPVLTLSLICPIWIRAYVDEPELGLVEFGMKADVYTDTPGGKVYTGRVGFISPVAEFTPKTVQTAKLRTDLVYRLRIYVDNPDGALKQGMPVTVKLKS